MRRPASPAPQAERGRGMRGTPKKPCIFWGPDSPLRRWKRLEVEMQQRALWRTIAAFAAFAFCSVAATSAPAQNYPDRPVKIISDSAPGSAVDSVLRIIGD